MGLLHMKLYRKVIAGCCWIALLFLLAGCAAQQRFWPQEDIIGSETTAPDGEQVILIASRSSEFKKLLVAKLHEQLAETLQASYGPGIFIFVPLTKTTWFINLEPVYGFS
jgi:hypothetical protein